MQYIYVSIHEEDEFRKCLKLFIYGGSNELFLKKHKKTPTNQYYKLLFRGWYNYFNFIFDFISILHSYIRLSALLNMSVTLWSVSGSNAARPQRLFPKELQLPSKSSLFFL